MRRRNINGAVRYHESVNCLRRERYLLIGGQTAGKAPESDSSGVNSPIIRDADLGMPNDDRPRFAPVVIDR